MPLLAGTAKLIRPLQIPGVILSFINVILDPATEQRIQREIARGLYTEPAELINRALDLLESQENWLLRNKEAINERLTDSMAQAERGEVYTPEEVRSQLGIDRKNRAARAQ